MNNWQNFFHDATTEELDRYVATAHIAANPYVLIACIAARLTHQNVVSR